MVSWQDPKLRNRLLLPTFRNGRAGFMPEDKDSRSCRVSLMPPLCLKDGLRNVPLLLLFPVSVLPSHTFFFFFPPMLHGLQYITFPLPHYLNTLTSNNGTCCFLFQSSRLIKFWRIFPIEKTELGVAVEVVVSID